MRRVVPRLDPAADRIATVGLEFEPAVLDDQRPGNGAQGAAKGWRLIRRNIEFQRAQIDVCQADRAQAVDHHAPGEGSQHAVFQFQDRQVERQVPAGASQFDQISDAVERAGTR